MSLSTLFSLIWQPELVLYFELLSHKMRLLIGNSVFLANLMKVAIVSEVQLSIFLTQQVHRPIDGKLVK